MDSASARSKTIGLACCTLLLVLRQKDKQKDREKDKEKDKDKDNDEKGLTRKMTSPQTNSRAILWFLWNSHVFRVKVLIDWQHLRQAASFDRLLYLCLRSVQFVNGDAFPAES